MAGRGSRFAKQGIREPKPLVDLGGRPFFWWAVESVRRVAPIDQMVFVILEEHVADWSLDACITNFYPNAKVVIIPEVTSGSAETAALGVAVLTGSNPLVINDCDHAFVADGLNSAIAGTEEVIAGLLMTFRSASPNYSFIRLSEDGSVAGTVEKQVVSDFAIAGCYVFSTPKLYLEQYATYVLRCPYPELFISGIYNQIIEENLKVEKFVLEEHFAFGTPEEYANVQSRMLSRLADWR